MIIIECPMYLELECLLKSLEMRQDFLIDGFAYYQGFFQEQPVVLAYSHVGPVNAALCTYIGIQRFRPAAIISQGVAGAQHPDMVVGDLVIGDKSCFIESFRSGFQPLGQGTSIASWECFPSSYPDRTGEIQTCDYYESDPALVALAQRLAPLYRYTGAQEQRRVVSAEPSIPSPSHVPDEPRITTGSIGTGYSWVRELDRMRWNNTHLGVSVVDMETAAVAQVCRINQVPFLGVRVVSDNSFHKPPQEDVEYFDEAVAYGCQHLVRQIAIAYSRSLKPCAPAAPTPTPQVLRMSDPTK